jgi:acyl carrier protein
VNVSTDPSTIRAVITEFLDVANKAAGDVTDDTGLYAGGLELDSLEAAELSALLEDEFDTDPFSTALAAGDEMPQTVGDIVAFYGVTSSA